MSEQNLKQSPEEKDGIIKHLTEENKRLEKQLEELNEKLLDAEAFKSHFISNVTNEIVNPFSSILGLSKSMMTADDNQKDEVCHLAGLIYSEAAFLDFQLNNTFAAAKLEAGEVVVEASRVDLQQLIDDVLESLQPEQDRKQIKVSYELVPENTLYFHTDKEKLKLILVNLISNGIKFSEKGRNIQVRIGSAENLLKVDVEDEGIGMDKQEIGKIFDRFHRVDSRIHSLNPGNGLGLAVVDGLVHVLDGTIDVVSTPGNGSVFTVKLPESVAETDFFDEDGLFSDDQDQELF
ncbi:MAG: HAMP domain-containing histidine kinase [Bacteroidales bacterium]|nr:HAMP domain-containing histidine kinase [Bacteroidales bacterium]